MIGRRLSHYEIVARLGEGGMGVVWKARDTRLARFVAIKILGAGSVDDPERKRRFTQEAKAASALNHPGIVTIYDIADDGETSFIAMEYVQGKTLSELIGRKGLALNVMLAYATQAAEALAKAHAAGIIHRDLKPSNIMVTDDGLVKILDFGVAKLAKSTEGTGIAEGETRTMTVADMPRTEEGTVVGTVAYMSPEQAEGKPVDARSDIFSFGSVLYEMATGTRVFQAATSASTLAAVLTRDPVPPSKVVKDLPRELDRIILRCLRKDAARRFQIMADLAVELDEIKSESAAQTESTSVTAPRGSMRRWRFLSAAVLALAAAAAWFLWPRPGALPSPSTVSPLTTSPGDEQLSTFSPDGSQVAFVWNGEARDNWDIYLKSTGAGVPLRLTTDPADDIAPAWSPDGTQIAFVRQQGKEAAVYLTPPLPGSEQKLATFTVGGEVTNADLSNLMTLSWLPDGRRLVMAALDSDGQSNGIVVIPIDRSEAKRLIWSPVSAVTYSYPVVSPSGRFLAYAGCKGFGACDVYLMELGPDVTPIGQPKNLTGQGAELLGITWGPDGKSVIYGSALDGQRLWRVPILGTGPPERVELAGTPAAYPDMSDKGHKLAYTHRGNDLDLWKFESGGAAPPVSFLSSTRADFDAQLSWDGKRVAFVSERSGKGREIMVANRDGTNPRTLIGPTGRWLGSPRWSPDEQWIAYDSQSDDGHWQIYKIESDGGRPIGLSTWTGNQQLPTWSRDGRWVYCRSDRTGRFEIWRMPADGGEGQQMTHQGARSAWESWDGKALFFIKDGALFARALPGGPEEQLVASVSRWNFYPVMDGVYYIMQVDPKRRRFAFELRFLDLVTRQSSLLQAFDSQGGDGLSVSPDRKTVLFSGTSITAGHDLMLIQNFR